MITGQLDSLMLAVLAKGPRHGYGVIEALRNRSDGVLDYPEGTVYPALHRLERQGLLDSTWSETGRKRRVYRLTRKGRTELRRERKEWRLLARAIARVLEPAGA
jgi:PadR family transcriptional regulator PadR